MMCLVLAFRAPSRKKRLREEWAPLRAPSAAPALVHASFIDREVPLRRCSTSDFVRKIWSAQPSRAHDRHHLIRTADAVAKLHAAGYRHGDLCLWNVLWSEEEEAVRLIDFTVGRKCDPCDDDLIIVEQENLEALSRGTDMTPNEAWADAVAAMGPDRARMFSSDADVEPVPGLGFGLGVD